MERYRKYYIFAFIPIGLSLVAIAQMPRAQSMDYARFSVLTAPAPAEVSPEAFRKIPRLVHTRHKIVRGETISGIASAYNTDIKTLQSTNSNEFIFMPYGNYMRVHNKKGLLYEVYRDGESFNSIASRFRPSRSDPEKFRQAVVKENAFPVHYMLKNHKFAKGDRVLLPGVYVNLDTYRIPVSGRVRISSGYGNRYHPILKRRIFHKGCDIPMPIGSPVYPARSGRVIFSGWKSGYGNTVEVKHRDGYITRYGHLSVTGVTAGQEVQKGKTLLGKVGSSGLSTGPHLHFEIITPGGKSVNPVSKIGRK
ncbi:MAG: hypothetical protein COT17_04425 [Elusimicrobia bacterium CG08_land_8_20_14_0_20_51_18]|nr:MAG: hypothetical protein COT17_04425 [Elusimicrobia bacterium CG08_land_8_20_14_0_20_51_18]